MSSAVILARNDFCWLNTTDEKVKQTLWQSLRWRAKNYWYNRAFRQHKWDGFDEFYKMDSGRFLTGLMPEVISALKFLNCAVELKDERIPTEFAINKINIDFLKSIDPSLTLYDYQPEIVNMGLEEKRCVFAAPTSAGKSLMMTCFLKCLKEKTPTLVLANKTSLTHQNYNEFIKWGIPNIGRLYDKYEEPNFITCANWQSIHKIEKILPKIKVIIVDEIHEMMSAKTKLIYRKLKNCDVRIGVSATPFKFGGKDKTQKYEVKGYFGPILKIKSELAENGILTTKKLQEHGMLSKSNCIFYTIDKPEIPYDVYIDAVKNGIAENIYFHQILVRLVKKLKGRTLIIVERTRHGDILNSLIPNSMWVQGKDNLDTRDETIKFLQSSKGNLVGIATQGIFNTGINVKVHNLINAAGGNAEHTVTQRLGRGLRVAGDKNILNYYDFIFTGNPYLLDHSNNRIKTIEKQGHKVQIMSKIDF